ncbi:MAG: multicopper oxidase domain-containing protein [Desulfotalea sp.]
MKRRTILKGGLATLGVSLIGGYSFLNNNNLCYANPPLSFKNPLPIPPILEATRIKSGNKSFELTVQNGETSFFQGITTPTMGYNGNYLGPTIKVRNGDDVMFKIQNTLHQETTVHWHGLHVPANWDGGPRQKINAGKEWNPNFTIKQPAATLWYHPHAMGLTGEQVYNGLAGMFIIEDEISDKLNIPKTYGLDDFPIVLQDRRFYENGKFAYVQSMMDVMHGVIGNYLLVNGEIRPQLKVPKGLVRLRVLNGSNSTIYKIAFADGRSFVQIATDGGFQENPVSLNYLYLSPGERSEIIVDFSNDDQTLALSLLVDQSPGGRFEAMQISVDPSLPTKLTSIPETLAAINWLSEKEAAKTRTFVMETMSRGMGMRRGGRLTINGENMDMNKINETVKLGDVEIWEIENYSAMMMKLPHSMHLHDVQFQILDRNGVAPPPHEKGRKDTVLIPPGEKVRIIAKFEDYTGVYMYHCHLLEHEDNGMMGQFEVVK